MIFPSLTSTCYWHRTGGDGNGWIFHSRSARAIFTESGAKKTDFPENYTKMQLRRLPLQATREFNKNRKWNFFRETKILLYVRMHKVLNGARCEQRCGVYVCQRTFTLRKTKIWFLLRRLHRPLRGETLRHFMIIMLFIRIRNIYFCERNLFLLLLDYNCMIIILWAQFSLVPPFVHEVCQGARRRRKRWKMSAGGGEKWM